MTATPDLAAFQRTQPVLTRNEGVWDGFYRRYDSTGALMSTHRSRVIFRLHKDREGPDFYSQTNVYRFADGRRQVIESTGRFDGQRLVFGSDRGVLGWASDDVSDPHGRTCMLYMEVTADTPQLKTGTICYELAQLSDCGRYRMRMSQYSLGGRLIMRTLIDEERISADWAAEDWTARDLDPP
jgi:hypothetical protein